MDKLGGRLLTSNLSYEDGRVFYQSIYVPSTRYVLPAVSIDQKHLDEILTRSVEALLLRQGFNRNFPRRVYHGPQAWGGLGILDIKIEEISQLKEFRHAIYGDSEPGTLVISSLKYSQIESGLGLHLMELFIQLIIPTSSCRCVSFFTYTTSPSL